MPYRISLEIPRRQETRQQGWVRQQLPDELGECLTDSLCIGPDISLLQTRYRPQQDLAEESLKQLEQPVLAITLGLAGESLFRGAAVRNCTSEEATQPYRPSVASRANAITGTIAG
ncbi:hypothetical protein ACFSQE_15440 [Vogesella fluminis]|uniref:hypothetical protein n=1 Tax=Vogesella fluminis TaxID=1069161 RepID=UPI0036318482